MALCSRTWALLLVLVVGHWAMVEAQHGCQAHQCNFVCDCLDEQNCSDEQNCGYSRGFVCDFEDPAMCGWEDQSESPLYTWERRQRGDRLPDSGPSSDYTTGTSAGWFMGVTSVSTDDLTTAVLVSPVMSQSALTCQLRLRYFIWDSGYTGLDGGALWASVQRVDGVQAVVWRPPTSSFRGWREDTVYLGRVSEGFRLRLHSRRNRGRRGDVAVDQLEFLNCGLPAAQHGHCAGGALQCQRGNCVEPHQVCDGSDDCGDGTDELNCDGYWGCDFEEGLCGWDLRTFSTLKWNRTSQDSLSASPFEPKVGPGRDHSTNTASGSFLYLTKPESMTNDWSHFQSPVLEATNDTHPCQMVLYTHQFGPRSGGLSVLVVDGEMYPVWERGGQLGDLWVKAEVEFVVNVTFQIVLVGAIRDEEFGGIAVDSIVMSPGCRIANESSPGVTFPKPPGHPCTSSEKMCDFHPDCENSEDEAKCGDFSYAQGITGWADASIGTQGWSQNLTQNGSSQGAYLYVTEFPGQQLSEARARTPLLGPSGPACAVEFSYSLTGNSSHIGELSVNVIDGALGTRSRLWGVTGKAEGEWPKAGVYIGARDPRFQVELEALSQYEHAQIAVKDIRYLNCHSGYLPAVGQDLFCNFETDNCNWYQDQTDNFDWNLINGMDHTIGVGRSLVVDMWNSSLRGLSGRLLSFPQLSTQGESCLSFFYKLYGPQTGSLSVKLLSGGAEVLVWTRSGAHGNQWHQGNCPIPHQHIRFQVVFEAIRSGFDGQVGIDDVSLRARPCPGPLACSFEGQTCGYTSSGSSPWVHQNKISGGVRHGPKSDHTLETDQGYYMITDSSANFLPEGHVTTLTSQPRDRVPNTECVRFWYHMGGEKPGTLNVYVKSGDKRTKIFSNSLNQGDAWRYANGNISASEVWQLQLEVVGAGGTQTHVAVDDIIISARSCPPPDTKCTLENGLCDWSNTQSGDQLDWEVTSPAQEKHYSTPPLDHTLQSERGHFLLLPSSTRDTAGQAAWLLSPHLPPTLGTCLRFWVHKPASHDGGLVVVRLYGEAREELLSVGEVSEAWRRFDIDIVSKEEYQIVFQGAKGKSGPLALDDIQYTPGVSCAGENTDPESPPPSDDKGGIAASVVVMLLLVITLAALLVFYLRRRGSPCTQGQAKTSASCGIANEAYDPSTADHVSVPPIDRKPEDGFASVSYSTGRSVGPAQAMSYSRTVAVSNLWWVPSYPSWCQMSQSRIDACERKMYVH
ncbi:apical endosomal glycoprotein isoform X1 [Anguilla anguilla]|uniref:apical endosomal glycoprotein isoform X1 n=2 Tax=Anguilla anguilla TaxID=7936 RepID=UPI0015A88841|nr:apical endosomal glycoprotein isoform X1 [Anguilla anguilla]